MSKEAVIETIMEKPKYKCDIRKAIMDNVMQNKNVYSLRGLLVISDIERRKYDDELCKTLVAHEQDKALVFKDIMLCSDDEIHKIRIFISHFVSNDTSRVNKDIKKIKP